MERQSDAKLNSRASFLLPVLALVEALTSIHNPGRATFLPSHYSNLQRL